MSGPHVAFFDAYPHLEGGAQRTTVVVATELARRGGRATLVTTGDGPLTEAATAAGVEVHRVRLPGSLGRYGRVTTGASAGAAAAALPRAWAAIAGALRACRPDVVHANDHRGALLAAPAARLARTPVVWHAHSVDVDGRRIEQFAGRLVRAVVAPSTDALSALRGLPGRTPARVVGGAVRPDVLALPPARPSTRGRLVCLARLHPAKGVDVAIAAVGLLRDRGLAVTLEVHGGPQAGAEAYAASVDELVDALGLEHAVTIRRSCGLPHLEWTDADVYVQPSRAETFGLAALEAMSLGLPVVASGVGGLAELITDGDDGILVPPGDPATLADAIERLLTRPDLAGAIAARGRCTARQRTVERMVDELADVWQLAAVR